ncbi:MAG: LTA synthase family protein [Coriobacteriaceae bacterium]|nr:LTA synthase family protein [Coriobacteriaceae bacterium]
MPESTPTTHAAIPLFALAALIACVCLSVFWTLRRPKRAAAADGLGIHAHAAAAVEEPVAPAWKRLRPGMLLWPMPFAGTLIFLSVWIGQGLVDAEADGLDIGLISAGIAALGALTLLRGPVLARLGSLPLPIRLPVEILRDLALLTAVAFIGAWVIELPWNENLGNIPVYAYHIALIVIGAALLAAYLLGQRTGILCCLVPVACFGFGVAQHFVIQFKGAAILPSDLLSIGAAAEVGGSYVLMLTELILQGLLATCVCLCLLSFVSPAAFRGTPLYIASNAVANLALAVVVMFGIHHAYLNVSLERDLGISYDRWQPITTFTNIGFVPSFLAIMQDLAIPVPDGYDDAQAADTEAAYAAAFDATEGANEGRMAATAQFDDAKPAVIAIMNESFADLSLYDAVREAGYTGPAFYNSIPDALVRGRLMTPVAGGGTANTEFEFLTGNSSAFIGPGKVHYQLYQLSGIESLAKQFKGLGYDTTAIHPQNPNNYHRLSIYRDLGFDTFLHEKDFEGASTYHGWYSDMATYEKIIERLREDPDPQFFFDLTMQNHGGYALGTVPDEDLPGIRPAGIEDETLIGELNTYLACVNKSDEALAWLLGELQGIGRPVIVVFFGDHQPNVGGRLNDALHAGEESELEHVQRYHQSTYLVWANYDVAGREQVSWNTEIGANALAALTLDLAGAPLTDRQKSTLATRDQVTSLNLNGYLGADGLRYALDAESPYKPTIDALQQIQYLEFARKLR